MRGSPALVIEPTPVAPKIIFGLPSGGVLVTLKTSARNSTLRVSWNRNHLSKARSRLERPGLRTELRELLPISLATNDSSCCNTEMPSKRYSFTRGRPPLMRGNDGPSDVRGGAAIPGVKATSERTLRPFNGRLTILRPSMTCPRLACSVRRKDASSVGEASSGLFSWLHISFK